MNARGRRLESGVFSLVYVSSATVPFTPEELVDLLKQSHEKNARLGITGMLLYKDGNFMQVLEGDEAAVRGLYETIRRDPRHHDVITLLEEEVPQREFSEWSMGFVDLKKVDVRDVPGYSAFLSTPLTGDAFAANPSRCRMLLRMFRTNM